VKTELEVLVNTTLSELGLDLVELRLGGSRRRPVIDVRMEKLDGEKVSVDDCARVSRLLQQRLDEGFAALGDYVLEVSSAGLERPLKRPSDWRRFTGRTVSVLSATLGGRRELELVAVEMAENGGAEVAVLRDKTGADIRVPLAEVKEARLVFNWKR
jgi:ribosome maturation factor RimP